MTLTKQDVLLVPSPEAAALVARAQHAQHDHITRVDRPGCPACDKREGRTPPVPQTKEAHMEPDLSAFPVARHRIEDARFVCLGDAGSLCHQYPGCDGEHEFWPCGCEYISHAECWVKPWIDAGSLSDSHAEGPDNVTATLDSDFPDGDVEWEWEGEYVLWNYVAAAPATA